MNVNLSLFFLTLLHAHSYDISDFYRIIWMSHLNASFTIFIVLKPCIGQLGLPSNKRQEVTERWRKLHNEELHKLQTAKNIIRVIKERMMR
jgi:hypothetical protein